MKIKIHLKDPDGVYESINCAAKRSVEEIIGLKLSDSERESLVEGRHESMSESCSKWIKYGEYVTIEIDTDAGTAVVLPS